MSELKAPLNPLDNRAEFEAEVISTDDPDRLMRARVRVFGLMDDVPDDALPWATYKLPVGARFNEGDFRPAHLGDIVWVDFPYTTHGRPDSRRPRITGSVHFCPDSVPNLPHESWQGPDAIEHKRTGNEPVHGSQLYHDSRVFTQHGITIEWERTGVYRITHRASGTAFELCETGDSVLHTEGNAYQSSSEKTEYEVGKGLVINVLDGGANITVQDGGASIDVQRGDADISAANGNLSLSASGDIVNSAGGDFVVMASNFKEVLG